MNARASVDMEIDDEGIAVITINQPAKRNAMTYPMIEEMFDWFHRLGDDPRCRVIILTGAGDTFCSGTDLTYLAAIPPDQRGLRTPTTDRHGLWNITACPRPVIAAVDGSAVGMGAEWTSHCDVRIASHRARFSWNFAQRGLVPDTGAGSWLLPRLIGVQAALRLLYSGDWLSASEARRIGYVAEVVPPEGLLHHARLEARRYLMGGPEALRRTKRLVYEGLGVSTAEHQFAHREALAHSFRSSEHAEGVAAFIEGRSPQFTHHRPPGATQ